jgi:hypothetical protein
MTYDATIITAIPNASDDVNKLHGDWVNHPPQNHLYLIIVCERDSATQKASRLPGLLEVSTGYGTPVACTLAEKSNKIN